MILATARTAYNTNPIVPSVYARDVSNRNNAYTLSSIENLDTITFHLVDCKSGTVTDRISFAHDYILLASHACVSMNGANLAILSIRHQVIRQFYIDSKGFFVPNGQVGAQVHQDEEIYSASFGIDIHRKRDSNMLYDLKQRIFSYLYRSANDEKKTAQEKQKASSLLFYHWPELQKLIIQRMQYLDCDHFLLKLGFEEAITARGRSVHLFSQLKSSFLITDCIKQPFSPFIPSLHHRL